MTKKSTLAEAEKTATKTLRMYVSDIKFLEEFSEKFGHSQSWVLQNALKLFREKYKPASFK